MSRLPKLLCLYLTFAYSCVYFCVHLHLHIDIKCNVRLLNICTHTKYINTNICLYTLYSYMHTYTRMQTLTHTYVHAPVHMLKQTCIARSTGKRTRILFSKNSSPTSCMFLSANEPLITRLSCGKRRAR